MKATLLKIFSVLACTLGLVSSARAIVITFDNLPDSTLGAPIPDGYAGLDWNNFDVLDGKTYPAPNTGFTNGVVSSPNVAFSLSGLSASITPAAPAKTFTLSDGFFTSAFDSSGLLVTAKGYGPGGLLYTTHFTLYTTGPSFEDFDWTGLSEVIFSTPKASICGPSTQFVVDNLCVELGPSPISSVPEPTKMALAIFSLAMGISGALRSRGPALLPARV